MLLLYSGGLDTSVMLKWIQDSYDAEVVCLTVNLGQPGEDYEVIEGKALQLGALECHVVDAREEFAARVSSLPAIKANALYGGGYPLFTALGRPLIAKLAVEYARSDGLRHDRPRLHRQGQRPGAHRGDDRDARARAEGDRAGALLADGPRGGDRLRARARHPGQGRRPRPAPYSIDDNLWGRSSEGRWIEDLDHAPEDDVFQLVTPSRATRPTRPRSSSSSFERGVPGRARRRAPRAGRADRTGRRDRRPPRRRHRRPHRGPHRRAEGARHLRGAGGGDHAARPPGARAARRARSTRTSSSPQLDRQWAYLVYAGPVVGAAARRPRRLHGARQRAGHAARSA